MKSLTASVTCNVLAGLLSLVLFGGVVIEGAGLRQKGIAVCPVTEEKILLADGSTPIPQWPLPPPKAIA